MITVNNRQLCEHCFAEINTEPCPNCGYEKASYRNDPITLMLGSVLAGRYMIGGVIGKGGFGITYLAYDLKLDSRIAVKEYYPMGLALRAPGTTRVSVSNQQSEEPFRNGAEKFYNEAKMVAKFNGNPNIVSVHDFFYENDTVYFTMGYLEGETLKSYVKRNKVTEGQAVRIMQDISNALMAAHSMRILHRDVSPDNIMICDDGTIRLLDFGAARQVMAEQSQSLSVILKQGFAPLEQYQKRGKQGPWTDIYALGATIYNALTGDVLDDPMSRLDDDSDFQSNKYGITYDLWRIISKCMMLKSEDRYRDIFELKKDLNDLTIEPEPIVEVRPGIDPRPAGETAKAFESTDPNATVLLSQNPLTERTGGETKYTGGNTSEPVAAVKSFPAEEGYAVHAERNREITEFEDKKQSGKSISPVIIFALAAVFLVLAGITIGLFAAGRFDSKTDAIEADVPDEEETEEKDDEEPAEEKTSEEKTSEERTSEEDVSDEEKDDEASSGKKSVRGISGLGENDGDTEDKEVEDEDEDNEEDEDSRDEDTGKERMLSIAYVDATSELKASSVDNATYYASNLYDGNYATAWVDGALGSAAGQSLTIHLKEPREITRIDIFNGYLKTRYRYTINGQVTLAGIDYGDGHMREHEINVMYPGLEDIPFSYDELNPTVIINDKPVCTDTIRITVLADIPGTKYYDTAISEIEIYGR